MGMDVELAGEPPEGPAPESSASSGEGTLKSCEGALAKLESWARKRRAGSFAIIWVARFPGYEGAGVDVDLTAPLPVRKQLALFSRQQLTQGACKSNKWQRVR